MSDETELDAEGLLTLTKGQAFEFSYDLEVVPFQRATEALQQERDRIAYSIIGLSCALDEFANDSTISKKEVANYLYGQDLLKQVLKIVNRKNA